MIMVRSRCPLLNRGDQVIGGEPIFMALATTAEHEEGKRSRVRGIEPEHWDIIEAFDKFFATQKPTFNDLFFQGARDRSPARSANSHLSQV